MKPGVKTSRFAAALAGCLFLLAALRPALAAEGGELVAGHPQSEALRLGEIMYMDGVLPSGAPLRAIVNGDIEIKGTMVTCRNCHLRSGLGSLEGGVFSPPTNGAKLYAPLRGGQDVPGGAMKAGSLKFTRPAYNDESLVVALREGIDAKGRKMSTAMPRYLLEDGDVAILVHYLKNLSSKISPGVSQEEIAFAVVVSEGVDPRDRAALLEPIEAYVREEWNAQQSTLLFTWGRAPLRKIALRVWELKGPPESWGGQLEERYREQPVFALLGGKVQGKWDPIHEFCERNRIPCILPVTDLPVVSKSDLSTLYFSKGYYQEGEAAAKFLARVLELPAEKRVVQVFRDNDEGNALARGFSETWKKLGNAVQTDSVLPRGGPAGPGFWEQLAAAHPDSVLLSWLGPDDLAGLSALGELPRRPSLLVFSSTMLGGRPFLIPDGVRDFTYITYPSLLPGEGAYGETIVTNWSRVRKIARPDAPETTKVFFLTRLLTRVLTDIGDDLYRGFFLDLFDESTDQVTISANYPRLSFGPGQRYASKGCYIITLTKGPEPRMVRQSDWVIY